MNETFQKVGVALGVAVLFVGGSAIAATVGPSPDVHAYSANAEQSGVITGVDATGECVFTTNSHLVEVELTEDAYSEHDVRTVKVRQNNEIIDSAPVAAGASRSDGLCTPLGDSTIIAVSDSGEIVSTSELSISKIPIEELREQDRQ